MKRLISTLLVTLLLLPASSSAFFGPFADFFDSGDSWGFDRGADWGNGYRSGDWQYAPGYGYPAPNYPLYPQGYYAPSYPGHPGSYYGQGYAAPNYGYHSQQPYAQEAAPSYSQGYQQTTPRPADPTPNQGGGYPAY